jgi:hypothetical protein
MQLFIMQINFLKIQTTSSHVNYLSCFASQLRAGPPTHVCKAVYHIQHTGSIGSQVSPMNMKYWTVP